MPLDHKINYTINSIQITVKHQTMLQRRDEDIAKKNKYTHGKLDSTDSIQSSSLSKAWTFFFWKKLN